mmetsp:Transcript_115279/g.224076  ORF Transcript_115279/g.224076 Transcript_115279/m.224076 type:complete len:105 (-) Transcript_115279:14-328(-)
MRLESYQTKSAMFRFFHIMGPHALARADQRLVYLHVSKESQPATLGQPDDGKTLSALGLAVCSNWNGTLLSIHEKEDPWGPRHYRSGASQPRCACKQQAHDDGC